MIEVSAQRLANYLKLVPTQRLGYLDDPDLVPADRAHLRQSLQAGLRRPFRVKLWSWRSRLSWRTAFKRLWGPALGLVTLAGIYGVATWQNAEPASLNRQVEVRLQYPNGTTREGALPRGVSLLVRRLDATSAEARQWRAHEGYITFLVPISALTFER